MSLRGARGVLAMFIAVAAFSFMDALLKTFAAHYPPAQVTFLRAISSLPFVLLPLWWQGRLAELRPVRPGLHLVRAVLGIAMLFSFIKALGEAPLASVYSVYMGAPLLIAAFAAWFLGERVGLGCWLAILVGLVGVLVILQPRPDGMPAAAGLAALLSALCYAAAVLVARVLTRTDTTASVVFLFLALIALLSMVFALPTWTAILASHWPLIVATGALGAVGQHYITVAFKHAPAAVVAPVEYTALIWGLGIDWVIWSVRPDSTMLLGAALVILAGLYVAWRERHPSADVAAAPTIHQQRGRGDIP
jgi:drug/metabolite transporter (DMT)-like permease